MDHEVGEKSNFSFSNGKPITDVRDVDFEYIIESTFGVCPECGVQLGKKQTFKIIKLIAINNGEHFVGYSDKKHTLKIDKKDIPKEHIKQKEEIKNGLSNSNRSINSQDW